MMRERQRKTSSFILHACSLFSEKEGRQVSVSVLNDMHAYIHLFIYICTHTTSNGLAVDEGRVDTSQDSTGEDIRMYLVCCIPQYATPCSASGDPQVIGSSARCDN